MLYAVFYSLTPVRFVFEESVVENTVNINTWVEL